MEQTIVYPTFRGSSASHTATLRLPPGDAAAPCPVVVNVHGGFWKTQWSLQVLQTRTLLDAFAGCATWDVEYARVDQAEPNASAEGGGFPHTCLDALAALNALADAVPEELRSRLDLERVYLCGHSAGGQMVLWLAMLSRLDAAQREPLAATLARVAGEEAAQAVRAGVSAAVGVRGVIGLAPVTCLSDALADGLSDHHDAAINFLWRCGPSGDGAAAAAVVGAACPLALLSSVPAPVGGAAAALRMLLVAGIDDVDVPAAYALKLAARAWGPPPAAARCWLALIDGADHYDVAALADLRQPGAAERWARVAALLGAFVAEDDAALAASCCASCSASLAEATARCAAAPPPTCARATLARLAAAPPPAADMDAAMARGLRRWLAWTGVAPPAALAPLL